MDCAQTNLFFVCVCMYLYECYSATNVTFTYRFNPKTVPPTPVLIPNNMSWEHIQKALLIPILNHFSDDLHLTPIGKSLWLGHQQLRIFTGGRPFQSISDLFQYVQQGTRTRPVLVDLVDTV